MQNDRTPNLDLPLPYVNNNLVDDVMRLREALLAIDTFAGNVHAATASKLATARKINGQNFDGTADITITAAAAGGTSSECSGNAATATKLATARKINGQDFDGTADITIQDSTKLPSGGTATAATKLATARKINGQDFDGTADITIPTTDGSKLPLVGGVITGTENATSATSGALQIRGGLGVTNDIYAGGNITSYSDIRTKRDIEPILDSLAKLRCVRGVTYTDKASGQRRTGVIAQEIKSILPEAVSEKDGVLTVAYGNLAGIFIQAINELGDELDKVKRRMAS